LEKRGESRKWKPRMLARVKLGGAAKVTETQREKNELTLSSTNVKVRRGPI